MNILMNEWKSKKSSYKFWIFGIVLFSIIIAILFAAVNISDVSKDAPAAEATFYNSTNAMIYGNWNPSGDNGRSYYYCSLHGNTRVSNGDGARCYVIDYIRFGDNVGRLFRNGSITVNHKVNHDPPWWVISNDYGGMWMETWSGGNFASVSTQWGYTDYTSNRTISRTSSVSGGTNTYYQIRLVSWTDDDRTYKEYYWSHWKLKYRWKNRSTDAYIDPWADVYKVGDSSAPTLSWSYNSPGVWATSKYVTFNFNDTSNGVNPTSIKINGVSRTTGVENGRSYNGVVVQVSSSSVHVEAYDLAGNKLDTYINVPYIDTANPYIVSNISQSPSSSTWTNGGVTISATVRDTQSGINYFNLAGSTGYYYGNTGNVTRSITVYNNGNYSGYAYDRVGKGVTLPTINVGNIDKNKPTVNGLYYSHAAGVFSNGWSKNNLTLYINASDNLSGLARVRVYSPNVIDTNANKASGTVPGTSYTYTHFITLSTRAEYRIIAYDLAGNVSDESSSTKTTPNIDKVSPIINESSINITGKLKDGTTINAKTEYSYSSITVSFNCSDALSGVWKATLNGSTMAKFDATSLTFNNVISANTIDVPSYVLTLYDKAENASSTTIFPLKDSVVPTVNVLSGVTEWAKTGAGGHQTIEALAWTGLSGGVVQMRRYYLNGTTWAFDTNTSFESYSKNATYMYDLSHNHVQQALSYNSNREGIEFYYFNIISNAGAESGWKGINNAEAIFPVLTESGDPNKKNYAINSDCNGAKTMIDNTAPIIKFNEATFTGNVTRALFSDQNNWIAQSFEGIYKVNDSLWIGGNPDENGINGSGLSTVTYDITYIIDGVTYTCKAESILSIGLNSYYGVFNGNQTKGDFSLQFGNLDLPFDGSNVKVPRYTITVTDNVGNSTSEVEVTYVDDKIPELELISAKTTEDNKSYNCSQQQNWVKQPIEFKFAKTIGQSGANIEWGIGGNWYSMTNPIYGTIDDSGNSLIATITIPTSQSFDSKIFFRIHGNSKYYDINDDKWVPLESQLTTDYYIAIDNIKPTIISYNFTDLSGVEIDKGKWSSTEVYLNVITSDDGDIPGSGVGKVEFKVNGTVDYEEMEKVSENHWKSKNPLGSENYQIRATDNVGWISEDTDDTLTYKPSIDLVDPVLEVSANDSGGYSYDSKKGTVTLSEESGKVYISATPTNLVVKLYASSEVIASGATLYYLKRDMDSFINGARYTATSKPGGYTLADPDNESQGWVKKAEANEGYGFVDENISIGVGDQVQHYGYDFLIVSGCKRMAHFEYGSIFVDMEAPVLDFNNIHYYDGEIDENCEISHIIAGEYDEEGNLISQWTNAVVLSRLFITDHEGSGIKSVIERGKESLEAEDDAINNQYGNGHYIMNLNDYKDYYVDFEDEAGNKCFYKIRPLIDNIDPTIVVNAKDTSDQEYIVVPDENGVGFINKNITMTITITYGPSAFDYGNTDYTKGNEKYTFKYNYKVINSQNQIIEGDYVINEMMGTNTEWTNPYTGNTFKLVSQDATTAKYELILSNDQKSEFDFEVHNGISEGNKSQNANAAKTFAKPNIDSAVYKPTVFIDKIAPSFEYENYSEDWENVWYNGNRTVIFTLEDLGCGVSNNVTLIKKEFDENETTTTIVFNNIDDLINETMTQNEKDVILQQNPYIENGKYIFVMDAYREYNIAYEDNIGNSGSKGPIIPLIDTFTPEFTEEIEVINQNIDYTGGWTYGEVKFKITTSVGISGQKLQYSINGGNFEEIVEIIALSGISSKETSYIVDCGDTQDDYINNNYSFRVVSGSGNYTDYKKDDENIEFEVKIDNFVPEIYLTTDYEEDTWTNESVVFTFSIKCGQSDSTTEFATNVDELNSNWDSRGISLIGLMQNSDTTNPTLTINTVALQKDYYFRVKSGAGKITEYYRDDYRDEDHRGFGKVKIDKITPSMDTEFKRISDIVYDNNNEIDYGATWDGNEALSYDLNSWTSSSIIVKIDSTFGASGAFLRYSDENDTDNNPILKHQATTIEETEANNWLYNGINISNYQLSSDGSNISYMIIEEDQNRNYKFYIESNAKNQTGFAFNSILNTEGNVMIDKSLPYMELSASGTKSVKWTDNGVNDLHKWYTSQVVLSFKVGKFDINNNIVYSYPESDAEVFYRTKTGSEDWSAWSINGMKQNTKDSGGNPYLVIGDNQGIVTYQFKIVSKASKEFYLTDYYQNEQFDPELYIKTLTSDSLGEYTIKVDTNDYKITIAEFMKNESGLPVENNLDMAEIELKVNGTVKNRETPDANAIIMATYKAKRGDEISISINDNEYNDFDKYGYIFKRVVFKDKKLNENGDAYDLCDNTIESEEFNVNMFDMDYNIEAFFTKEIYIEYSNLEQTKQNNTIDAVTVSSKFNNVELANGLQFEVNYSGTSYYPNQELYFTGKSTGSDDDNYPKEVGEYDLEIVTTNDDSNDPNYLIHNPEAKEVIVYFNDVDNNGDVLYNVADLTDFEYINIYNDTDNKYDFLGINHQFSKYRQTNNIEVGENFAPIKGYFYGIYDGNNKEIYSSVEISTSDTFGIFESIVGTVINLGIRHYHINATSISNVGLLAGSAVHAVIRNCYAIGEMYISGENANIGGLVGYVYNETTLENNYTDVAISNKGNSLSGNIGGFIGLADNDIIIESYAIGAIELYNVDNEEINCGTFIGSLPSVKNDGDLSNGNEKFVGNKYLTGNLFINEEIEDNNGIAFVGNEVVCTLDEVEGLIFARFVDDESYFDYPGSINIAEKYIASTNTEGKQIMDLAIARVRELGMEYGFGTEINPFEVDSQAALAFIDKYVWAHYQQTKDINCEGEFTTIAAHKVFNGVYNGMSSVDGVNVIHKINNVTMNSTDNITGMFGKVSGIIMNVDIRGLDMNINYTGTDDSYAGGIAAIIVPGASINTVYVLGNILATCPNAKLRIGGIAGLVEGASLIDTLSIANVKSENTKSVDIGGTIGYINDSSMRNVFSLARVEGYFSRTGSVGAIAGTIEGTTTANMFDYYAILGNTYAHGQSYDYLAGYAPDSEIILSSDNTNYKSFDELRSTPPTFNNGNDLDSILSEVYPLDGKGTINNPFQIYTLEDYSYINDFLYANYKIKENLDFTGSDFETIGIGAKFTGSISGAMSNAEYIASGGVGPRNHKITGMTDSLVYYNAGTIEDLKLDIRYQKSFNEDVIFGGVAVYNTGSIKGLTVEGNIIIEVNGSNRAEVGGFVGNDLGGEIIGDLSYELSSISSLGIFVTSNQIYAGGFIGKVIGETVLSYVISDGMIYCSGGTILAGTIGGVVIDDGATYNNHIETSAQVFINGEEDTKEFGFNINNL